MRSASHIRTVAPEDSLSRGLGSLPKWQLVAGPRWVF
jgi:hypothetical protein